MSHLSYLRYLRLSKDRVRIGALTRVRDLDCNVLMKRGFTSLAEAARGFGGAAIANMATVGGNVATALPTSDLVPIFLSLDADVQLKSYRGKRTVKFQDFLLGGGKTIRRPEELITEINFRIPRGHNVSSFRKIGGRSANCLALVSLAVFLNFDRTKTIEEAGVAFSEIRRGTPGRARFVELGLRGRKLTEDVIQKASAELDLDLPAESASEMRTRYWKVAAHNLLRDRLRACRRMGD